MKIKRMNPMEITVCLVVVFGSLFINVFLFGAGCSTSNNMTCPNGEDTLTCSCNSSAQGCTCTSDAGSNYCNASCEVGPPGHELTLCTNTRMCPPAM